jgi:hypothetical protein
MLAISSTLLQLNSAKAIAVSPRWLSASSRMGAVMRPPPLAIARTLHHPTRSFRLRQQQQLVQRQLRLGAGRQVTHADGAPRPLVRAHQHKARRAQALRVLRVAWSEVRCVAPTRSGATR